MIRLLHAVPAAMPSAMLERGLLLMTDMLALSQCLLAVLSPSGRRWGESMPDVRMVASSVTFYPCLGHASHTAGSDLVQCGMLQHAARAVLFMMKFAEFAA